MSCEHGCRCDCCQGTQAITPRAVYNRPGLDALSTRIGEHGAFLETMKARLSSSVFPALAGLGSRTTDDPSIAMLDSWALVADVLTFYRERLANEGYLRTATERRSTTELARLVGYRPRPGVAATVYVAYEIDRNAEAPVEIPAGSAVQSLPGPGELPQTFETSEKFVARKEWNAIRPRLERPQSVAVILAGTDVSPGARIYLKGASTGLAPNDPLLIQIAEGAPALYRVTGIVPDSAADRTLVRFTRWSGAELGIPAGTQIRRALQALQQTPPSQFPAASLANRILTEIGDFLGWFFQEAIAEPVQPQVHVVLETPELVTAILSTLETLRQAAVTSASDKSLAGILTSASPRIRELSALIEEFTGLAGGGTVGQQTDALADRLDAVDLTNLDAGGEDARLAALMRGIVSGLAASRSVPPRNSQTLARDPARLFDRTSDVGTQAVAALAPAIAEQLATAIRKAKVAPENPVRVFALRQKSLLFGATAPRKVVSVDRSTGVAQLAEWDDDDINAAERKDAVHLEAPNEKLKAGGWIVLDYSAVDPSALGQIHLPNALGTDAELIARAGAVRPKMARTAYNISGQTTRIPLLDARGENAIDWFTFTFEDSDPDAEGGPDAFQLIRNLVVLSGSEELPLALEPIEEPICGGDEWIETDALYTGLETGRWLTVSGERSDVPGTEGVRGSELVMLDALKQDVERIEVPSYAGRSTSEPPEAVIAFAPGEVLHTYIKLAAPLAYCYKRATVAINANVVKATHGETRRETLGSGDAATPLQSFALRQPPLTHVSANEPDGIASTLRLYVNGAEWRESEAMVALGPGDRSFVTRTDDAGRTSVVFGTGQRGARLPTGVENVKAIYRNGIGKQGNVKTAQISQLLSRPLGVKGVINPIEAAGGADRETRDQIRNNAPLAVMALDRLVGTRDYADFARTFPGIAKATSARILAGGTDGVYVTIAGADDMPVPKSSDLYMNLVVALRTYGDPDLSVTIESRELLMLVASARIAIASDYLWEDVVGRVRAKLLDHYSFERRELGKGVVLSEVIALVQAQRGVAYVDVDALGAVSQLTSTGELRAPPDITEALKAVIDAAAEKGRPDAYAPVRGIRADRQVVLPAQLAIFVPALPETLILTRIEA